ncbi:MAG: magnesium-translocating P-type ATPase [Candidatus Thermoplasmatota archaeon]|nr:magnesium-translocating P-type ATPase [Candidatus Thermoplasmatota archaeon]
MPEEKQFWSVPIHTVLAELKADERGLSEEEAKSRLQQYGPNALKPQRDVSAFRLFFAQFKSPLILILLFAAAISFALESTVDGIIIVAIIVASSALGFFQEYNAANTIRKLMRIVQIKAAVLRGGEQKEIPVENVVPGDVVVLGAGDIVPGDCIILDSKDLFVDESSLTGESYPADKTAGTVSVDAPLNRRTNVLFMGTHVVSGKGNALVAATGAATEFGKISKHLKTKTPETEFERGARRFGYSLIQVTAIMTISVFAINVFFHRPVVDSLMFSVALAVGLTPELLPAIISVTLAYGARKMAKQKVIVKKLISIENFGSMGVLCSDKTGTLTEGKVKFYSSVGVDGEKSERVHLYAYLNSSYKTGFVNLLDDAILAGGRIDISGYAKLDEVPYDFVRKRMTVLAQFGKNSVMISKGAVSNIMDVCNSVEAPDGSVLPIEDFRPKIDGLFRKYGEKGYRTLGVAYLDMGGANSIRREDERGMVFLGLLLFHDPLKEGINTTLGRMKSLGVSLKMITGDNVYVAAHVGKEVGLSSGRILTGSDIVKMGEDALVASVKGVDIFAEIEPNQKERIILALKKAGMVVGYMGDGINDVTALRSADVGLSVNNAVDVAKESADIVLLEKDLGVLADGVIEGRKTFANTLKYIMMAISSNFGNMFSMVGATLFMPFLPLLPKQILLLNLLSDISASAIATDKVDNELVAKPRRWDIKFIRRFMLVYGGLSSVFDFVTFGALLFWLGAWNNEPMFQTGWFISSECTQTLILLAVRSRKPFWRGSLPSKPLLYSLIAVVAVTIALPYLPFAGALGLMPMPPLFILAVLGIVGVYLVSAELLERRFYKTLGKDENT